MNRKINTLTEAAAIVAFLDFADNAEAGSMLGEAQIELIQTAAARIRRQIEAARTSNAARKKPSGGRNGGRPPKKK